LAGLKKHWGIPARALLRSAKDYLGLSRTIRAAKPLGTKVPNKKFPTKAPREVGDAPTEGRFASIPQSAKGRKLGDAELGLGWIGA
jgi:hypothetical protein